jgi:hypothetical protein
MALSRFLPYPMRPAVVVRRRAIWRGVFGSSMFWKIVAGWVFGRSTLKKFFGRQPEYLGKERVKTGEFLTINVYPPLSRRERRRTGITKAVLRAQAEADVRAARRAS